MYIKYEYFKLFAHFLMKNKTIFVEWKDNTLAKKKNKLYLWNGT